MQLTPTFQIAALQLRSLSNVVTMRLSASQQPQSRVILQATWEIAKFQPTPGGFGVVALAPSQRKRPTIGSRAFFGVAGLQLLSDFEAAPLQVTPCQQTSVVVTGCFEIAGVEFSPSFKLGSIVLNSSANELAVQLPGAHNVEAAVRFEVVYVQLGSSGEIGMMQLNRLDQGPMQSPQIWKAELCDAGLANNRRIANAIETERLENALCDIRTPAANDPWTRTPSLNLEPADQ